MLRIWCFSNSAELEQSNSFMRNEFFFQTGPQGPGPQPQTAKLEYVSRRLFIVSGAKINFEKSVSEKLMVT